VNSAAVPTEDSAECWVCGAKSLAALNIGGIRIFECPACGLGFQPTRTEYLADLYDHEYFDEYDCGRDYGADESARWREAHVRVGFVQSFVPQGRLLELGAAAGHFAASAISAGYDVVAVEPNGEMAERARRRFGISVFAGPVEDVVLAGDDFDVICGWHVLEHLPAPRHTVARLAGALRRGGIIAFEVPNFASVRARRERANWRPLDPVHHVAQYTPEALRRLFARIGLETLDVETVPWAVYKTRLRASLSYARRALELGRSSFAPHPWKHELLRGVARRSD
jgi:2-polyprenyl-3-methyl-5-hydroxy-6-metoxy-1,4-benzoquinol methylase